jgi:RHS repeat-associated protein
VKPKTSFFQAISQTNVRTARRPWLFLFGVWLLLRNLIIGWFAPIPTTQHTIPRRKPLRRSADGELRLTEPRHCGRSIAQVFKRLLQRAKEAINAVILPWRMRRANLGLSLVLSASSVFATPLSQSKLHQKAVAQLSASILNGVAWPSEGRLAQTMSMVMDHLGRVQKQIGASANEVTAYTYDANGNELTKKDPNQNLVKNDFDALDRLTQITDPDNNPVAFTYDPQDNLVEVSDPRQLKTNYGYNGFDELTKLTSPDTGVTDYSYDASGNLRTRKDARNITETYQYDADNRIQQISYPAMTGANPQPAETLSFTYDEAAGGAGAKGRLTTATDGTATTKYQYDAHGRVINKAQTIGSVTKTQTMRYKANGQLDEHTLPSGAIVKYSYRADGRVLTISVNGTEIVRDIEYFAFGEPKSWKLGPTGTDKYQRVFDLNGRIKEHTVGSATRAIGFDPGSRITSVSDGAASANQWAYSYDKLDRLKTAANSATAGATANSNLAWTFDATGNRLSEARGTPAISTTYAIDSVSNKLTQVGAVNRSYDSVGNTVAVGTDQSVYSSRNRLVRATKAGITAEYGYNAFGERVRKTVGATTSQFVYDDNGHVLGEYDAAGSLVSEYVWLADVPVAVIRPSTSTQGGITAGTTKVYLIQPDHLDTPRVIVNAANQMVWRWDSAPFGDTNANEQPTASLASFQFNLRFPGQQFDAETGSHYNYFRDYEAATGRYLQSDPIGLDDRRF